MEKPMIISPSGTSHDTVAESALKCMTDTLTGAGGRSEGEHRDKKKKQKTERGLLIHQILHILDYPCHLRPGRLRKAGTSNPRTGAGCN